MAKVYVGTYHKYNGSIAGKWLDLEDYSDYAEFLEACSKLHSDESDPELMFQDFEDFPERWYSESGIDPKVWEWLELGDDDQREIAQALIDYGFEWGEFDIDECNIIDRNISEHDVDSTVGYYWLFESGCYEIPDNLSYYIDCEKFGRDVVLEGTYLLTESGILFEYCR